jgi:hypothetical protein
MKVKPMLDDSRSSTTNYEAPADFLSEKVTKTLPLVVTKWLCREADLVFPLYLPFLQSLGTKSSVA